VQIIEDTKLDFKDVLLKPKRSTLSSRSEVDIEREFKFKYSPLIWKGVPVISSNMTSVTTFAVLLALSKRKMLGCLPKAANVKLAELQALIDNNRQWQWNGIYSFGIEGPPAGDIYGWICLDVANGYLEKFAKLVGKVRKEHPSDVIIAGNVVSAEMTQELILMGADIVKVGLGSGSACATREKAGVGVPQLSAVMECADAAHGLGGHIISDGGCTTPGDVAKAFCAGADMVMLGGLLAGHEENGTHFYGMSSEFANQQYAGGLKDYRAAEGFEMELKPRGPIDKTLQEIEGGLRSCGSYIGARRLKDFPKCSTFVRVNRLLNDSLRS
jgi:GMP reductase